MNDVMLQDSSADILNRGTNVLVDGMADMNADARSEMAAGKAMCTHVSIVRQ